MVAHVNCKETTGLLFKHPCKNPATTRCAQCGKPVCAEHARSFENATYCITCLRALRKTDPVRWKRFSSTYYDDPYFYWYVTDQTWDDYDESDYRLFQQGQQGYADRSYDSDWQGS